MPRFPILLLAIILAISPCSAIAKGGGGGTVHVIGYTRSDGTHVRAYDRSGPSGGSGTGGGSDGYNSGDAQPANVHAQRWSRDIDVSAATYPHLHRAEPTAKSSYRNYANRTSGRVELDGHRRIKRPWVTAYGRLKHYNKILKEQLNELENEIYNTVDMFKAQFGISPFARISPSTIMRNLAADIVGIQHAIRDLKSELFIFQDIKKLKAWLKEARQRQKIDYFDTPF